MANYGAACARLESIAQMIVQTLHSGKIGGTTNQFTCNISKETYSQDGGKGERIHCDGDIFQAVISRQFSPASTTEASKRLPVLRTTNPSPYMVYLGVWTRYGDHEHSPETLVRLKAGRLTTFPVAGSRPRGAPEEDDRLEKELLADEKRAGRTQHAGRPGTKR